MSKILQTFNTKWLCTKLFVIILLFINSLLITQSAEAVKFRIPLSSDTSFHYYYDHDSFSGILDWKCGTATYDGHRGTDFSGGPRGRSIYAAADGTLDYKIDGFGDGYIGNTDGGGFGNYVRLNHSNGLMTYYGHMTSGSVTNKSLGSNISCSEEIGGVGTSGNSSGLHLHFEPRLNWVGFDPYAGSCSESTSWWVDQGNGSPSATCENTYDEVISTPSIPSGPVSGTVGASYTYSTGGATSNLGHSVEYRFNWGDGTYSSWSSSTTASKSWSSSGTYVVKAQARCATHTDKISAESSGFSVAITQTETVSTPNTPSGSTSGTVGVSYTYSTGGATSNLGHTVEYRFNWGDGSYSSWSSSTTASKSWSSSGTYVVKAQARCATHTDKVSAESSGLSVAITQTETVSIPNTPSGTTSGTVGVSYTYSTGGATSNLGHTVEYRFNWGDGSYSNWSSSTTATKSWASSGAYMVKAQARCATHTDKVSGESSGLSVVISGSYIAQLTVNASPVTGNISTSGGVNWYQFNVSSQGSYTIETWAGTLADNYAYLYGPNSQITLIEEDDDDGIGLAALIGPRTLSAGTYYVKVRAYSSSGTGTYTISVVNSQDEIVSTPNTPSGPTSCLAGTSYTYSTGGATSSLSHSVQYRFNWGDGTYSSWSSSTTATKSWSSSGTYVVKAQARCGMHTDKVSSESSGFSVTVTTQAEIISTPSTPSGPASGLVGTSYSYTTGGATSSLGHSVQYRFNWGDGTYSSWSSSTTASKSWATSGTYTVKVQARCTTHTDKVSSESSGLSVTISGSDIVQLTVNASPVTGNISTTGEVDWYKFTVPSQGSYTIETWAGTLLDNFMYLYGPNSQATLIETDDDDGIDRAALIGPRTLSTGTYYLKVRAYNSRTGRGTYTIQVRM